MSVVHKADVLIWKPPRLNGNWAWQARVGRMAIKQFHCHGGFKKRRGVELSVTRYFKKYFPQIELEIYCAADARD